jgi:tRNA(Met) C34 N-acetyltransferase TmcA
MDKIWEYFGTKRGMVSVRATEIEKVCKISLGQEGLCSEEISDQFTFIQLPNGMVIPRALAKKEGFI